MTQDEIIEMARKAGLLVIGTANGGEAVYTWPQGITDEIETFAKLVAAKEKEALAQPEEHNFCPRCGKRNKDIHTCTPPQD